MTTYNSYEEAKIANPESEIYKDISGKFIPYRGGFEIPAGILCKPEQYCKTYNQCDEFKSGMVVMDIAGIGHLTTYSAKTLNGIHKGSRVKEKWDKCFILRDVTLEEKPKRIRVEYERVDLVDHWEYFKLMSEEGDLYVNCTDLSYEGFSGDNINLANALHDGSCIYRKVEVEVSEKDEFIERCAWAVQDDVENVEAIASILFDAGCTFQPEDLKQ